MSFSAATAPPFGSHLQRTGFVQKSRLTASAESGLSLNACRVLHINSVWIPSEPVMLRNIVGPASSHRISNRLGRRGAISVPVAAFMLASVISVGKGPSAMADEGPQLDVDENSGALLKRCFINFG
jgi:hypothetical protein